LNVRLLLWLCRQFRNQPVLRIADGVWGACVYVTFPAKSLATAITVRQTVAEGGDDSIGFVLEAAIPQRQKRIQRLLHQFSVSHVFFSCMS
jgi:hypothetical protein